MFNGLQWWHVLIVVLVAVILFGGKRLPDAARGLGRSLRILKAEVGEMSSDKDKKDPAATDVPAAAASHPVTLTPTPLPATDGRADRAGAAGRGQAADLSDADHRRGPGGGRALTPVPPAQSLRSTPTTRPSTSALSPGIGSNASLCGISQMWPSRRL